MLHDAVACASSHIILRYEQVHNFFNLFRDLILSCCIACSYIGFRKGDPECEEAPATLPPPKASVADNTEVIDLRFTTQKQLFDLCESSRPARDPFAALLPVPPGAPANRLADFTVEETIVSCSDAASKQHRKDAMKKKGER